MLRPATPLSLCFLIAFVLLLLSVLSTPVIKAIPLASSQGTNFGVFGYCAPTKCSGIVVGYDITKLNGQNTGYTVSDNTRTSLSSILIVHPIAALLCLICFGLAAAAHFHAPSHSPRYLLALLIFTIPTLLVSLLAFLVDILLFIPHLQWGGWIVLAATIVIVVGIVMTCAMRRTLVSRRARKQRINENADMNGANFYGSRAPPSAPPPATESSVMDSLPRADSPPPLSTGQTLVNSDKGPDFATFDLSQQKNDDRQPLNPSRSNSDRDEGPGRYYGERGPPGPGMGRGPPRDQYGNPIPARDQYGQPLRHQNSNGTMGSQGSRGPPPPGFFRGRGGPPRGGPGGGYGPRGGYRGGPQGMRGPPPPGWNGGRGGMGPGPMMGRGGQRGPPPMYENDQYHGGQPQDRGMATGGYGAAYAEPRDVSPPRGYMVDTGLIGQAIEMDAVNGVVPPRSPNVPGYGLRDSDGDVQGMVGLQQQRLATDPSPLRPGDGLASPTSEYSSRQSEFVPARAAWNAEPQQQQAVPPQAFHTQPSTSRGLSPVEASPVELSAGTPRMPPSDTRAHARKQSTDYYEDVDPRFAPVPVAASLPVTSHGPGVLSSVALPSALTAAHPQQLTPQQAGLDPSSSYEELADGARSPAASDASHFTSISQRPVNPNWAPPPGEYPPGPYAQNAQQPQREDLLAANPDFGLPGVGPPGRGGRGGFRGRGGGIGRGGQNGLTPAGRYPGPDAF